MSIHRPAALVLIVLLVHLLVVPVPRATPPSEPGAGTATKDFILNAKNLSITNLNVLAIDAMQNDHDKGSIYVDSLIYKNSDNATFNGSREQFYDAVRKQQEITAGMKSPMAVFNTVRSFGDKVADLGGPVGVFGNFAANTYLDSFNEKLREQSETDRRQEAAMFFAGRQLDQTKLRNAQSAGPATFVKEMEAQAGLPNAFDDLPKEQHDQALLRLGEFTLGYLALTGKKLDAIENKNKDEFNKLRTQISHIEDCQKFIAGGMQDLLTKTEQNTSEIRDIANDVATQHKDLNLIQKLMFSTLPVDDQIKLVKESHTLDLSSAEKEKLEKNLENRKTIIDVATKWNSFVHTGNDVLGILDKLGADKTVVQNLSKGLAIGNAAFSAAQAYLTGNYLGAANAIIGMFGGGGQDAESAHFSAIMAKLDEIIEMQKQIIKLEIQILDAIHEVANLIIQNQIELRSGLTDIFALQQTTLNAVVSAEKSNLNYCEFFLRSRGENEGFIKEEGRFRTYGQMQKHFSEHENSKTYDLCTSFLDRSIALVPSQSSTSDIFFGYPAIENRARKNHTLELSQITHRFQDSVVPFFLYLDKGVDDADKGKRTVKGSFFFPSRNYLALKTKEPFFIPAAKDATQSAAQVPVASETASLRSLRPISTVHVKDSDPSVNFYYDFFDEFVSPEEIIEYANEEMAINSYRELVSSDGLRLLNPKELYTRVNTTAPIPLRGAFDWLTLAIAQQDLLLGDALLPNLNDAGFRKYDAPHVNLQQFMEKVSSEENSKDNVAALAHYLLGHSYLLLQNAIRYRMYATMDQKKISSAAYTWAWNTQDEVYMKALFGDSVPITWKKQDKAAAAGSLPTGWYSAYTFVDYKDGGSEERTVFVNLPEPSEVTKRELVLSSSLLNLIACRERVNVLLAQYVVGQQVSGKGLSELKTVLITQNYKPRAIETNAK